MFFFFGYEKNVFKRMEPYNFLNTKYKYYFYIYLDNSIFKLFSRYIIFSS